MHHCKKVTFDFLCSSLCRSHCSSLGSNDRECGGPEAAAAVPQHFYPPSTSSQLPLTSAEHSSPPTTYHQHSSPPNVQLTTTSDLHATISTSYSQPHPGLCGVPQPDPTTSYPTYPASTGHYPVTSTTSDSEHRIVSELITSISTTAPRHLNSNLTVPAPCTPIGAHHHCTPLRPILFDSWKTQYQQYQSLNLHLGCLVEFPDHSASSGTNSTEWCEAEKLIILRMRVQ